MLDQEAIFQQMYDLMTVGNVLIGIGLVLLFLIMIGVFILCSKLHGVLLGIRNLKLYSSSAAESKSKRATESKLESADNPKHDPKVDLDVPLPSGWGWSQMALLTYGYMMNLKIRSHSLRNRMVYL